MTDVSVCCTKHGGRGAWFGLLIAFHLCPVKLFKLSEFIHKITHTGPFFVLRTKAQYSSHSVFNGSTVPVAAAMLSAAGAVCAGRKSCSRSGRCGRSGGSGSEEA